MGQTYCKPCRGSRCSRLSRVKAEAAAAVTAAGSSDRTQAGPDPSVVQLLYESNNGPSTSTSTAVPPGSEPMSAPLTIPQVDANREVRITIEDNNHLGDPSSSPKTRKSHRINSREWLQQQRKRFTKPRSFGGQTKKTKKTKMALAHDEVIDEGSHPIVMVEASTMSREGSSSCNGSSSYAPLLVGGERIYLTPSGSGISQARYQPGLPLLSPTPRRPNPNRFPFLKPATASTETTHSSKDAQVSGGHESKPCQQERAQSVEENHVDFRQELAAGSSVTPPAIVAFRRPARTDGDQRGHYGSVTSNSPSIYYLAPSSPQILPIKEKRVSSVPSEALEPFPVLEDEDEVSEERAGEAQNNMVEDTASGGYDIEDNMAKNQEEQADEAQDIEVQEGAVKDSEEEQGCPLLEDTDSDDRQSCPLQADFELDRNFLSAVMAFVASSQGARPRSVSLALDEQRSEVLVHSSSSA